MKKGSALLIVLGMLAFVVMSAIAFSAYMRYSRMPSSFLRRTSSSRLLAKAALAEAIDIIDNSIGNSVYPGQSGQNTIKNYNRLTDDPIPSNVVDYWQDRCFIGSNALVSVDSTVSTLCVEALAYIPPPIINEVRYYSRRSLAGQWRTLGFDAGRFAFTAVDVSDYFDINSVRANPSDISGNIIYGRNSSDKGRITLSHCFENSAHTGYTYQPDEWDTFMDNYIGNNQMPLVSLADLSLAMNKQGLPATMNPFCNYILNNEPFVTSEVGPEAELLRNMTFVTDGWFAMTNRTDQIDIAQSKNQPFVGYGYASGPQQRLESFLMGDSINTPFLQRFLDRLSTPLANMPELVQLYDYLDENSVPLSLAMPTVERTPMITGVNLLQSKLKVSTAFKEKLHPEQLPPSLPPGAVQYQYEKTTSTLTLEADLTVNAGFVFPFKYKRPSDGTFKAQAALSITFVPADEEAAYKSLRRKTAKPVIVWAKAKQEPTAPILIDNKAAYVTALSEMRSLSLPSKDVRTEEQDVVLDDVQFDFSFSIPFTSKLSAFAPFSEDDDCSTRIIRQFKLITENGIVKQGPEVTTGGFPKKDCGWLPMNANLDNFVSQDNLLVDGKKYCPVIQVWVRVVNNENKTVDLTPAYWEDDALLDSGKSETLQAEARSSAERPLLRFYASNMTDSEIAFVEAEGKLSVGTGAAPQAEISDFSPKAYLVNDPRFNYAPEDMIATDAITQTFDHANQGWLSKVTAHQFDGDIFMATSDAGYLQSVYEFAHIGMTSAGNSSYGYGVMNDGGYNGNVRTTFDGCPANAAMWKTYSQYDSGSGRDYLGTLGIVNGQRGFRVNPYTPSENIMMAALANTPLDWWAASTNKTVNNVVHASEATAAKYSFSEMGSALVRLPYTKLEAVASTLINKFRAPNESRAWETIFDNLEWDDDPEKFMGVDLTSDNVRLHAVDRKFLHGFWKECFANRQQLFLIFVRAEPMMMGGGGHGQTPPQLGARAVALVWRDPAKTLDDVSGRNSSGGPRPHRTRILFYRQFD